jgi:hypothetical protein
MNARRLLILLILLIAYLTYDFLDAALPSAFSSEVRDSELDEAVHVQRRSDDTAALAVPAAPPERHVEPRDDSFIRQRPAVTQPPLRDVVPRRPAPHEARHAPAQSLDDH